MNSRETLLHGLSSVAQHSTHRRRTSRIDQATREGGLSAGIRELLSEKNTPEVIWDGDPAVTQNIAENKPVILISNHPRLIEPFVFLSQLPSRDDIVAVGQGGVQHLFGKEIGQRVIPVYHASLRETPIKRQERQTRNNEQMERAMATLEARGAVYIAPNGGGIDGEWKRGVATLMEVALRMYEAYYLMAHVEGSQPWEPVRLLLNADLKRAVRISQPTNVRDLPIPSTVKELPAGSKEKHRAISQHLEAHYKNWFNKES